MAIQLKTDLDVTSSARSAEKPDFLANLTERKVTGRDRMFFTEQLSLLIESGMPLYQSLELIKEQTPNPRFETLLSSVIAEVASGKPLSVALGEHQEVFSSTYTNLIAAGEAGGFLPDVLQELLKADERSDELRSVLVSAFTYPAFLILFSVLVIVFVLVFVFPKFGKMFTKIHDQLPASTKFLLATSDMLTLHWPWVLAGLVAGGYMLCMFLWSEAGSRLIDRAKLSTPIIGAIYAELYIAQCLRVLGLSLQHGVPVIDSLRACSEATNNSLFTRFLGVTRERVTEGGRIADGFDEADVVPMLARQMVRTAEEAGNLGKVSTRLADYYERELHKRLETFSKLIEPTMLLIMGGLVGVIVASLILPIFKLSRAVG